MSQTHGKAVVDNDGGDDAGLVRLLTPRQRRTLAAVWADGGSHRQTARAHGITYYASRKRINRARKRLREAGVEPPDARRRPQRHTPAFQLSLNENV